MEDVGVIVEDPSISDHQYIHPTYLIIVRLPKARGNTSQMRRLSNLPKLSAQPIRRLLLEPMPPAVPYSPGPDMAVLPNSPPSAPSSRLAPDPNNPALQHGKQTCYPRLQNYGVSTASSQKGLECQKKNSLEEAATEKTLPCNS